MKNKTLALCSFIILIGIAPLFCADVPDQLGTIARISFDQGLVSDQNESYVILNHGGTISDNGISGKCLRLEKGQYIVMNFKKAIKFSTGTIIFWIRPHWNYYDCVDNTLVSHTFVSFTWNNPKKGYFTISDGWWEPAGSLKTYFVLDNQQYAHTSAVYKYVKEHWTQIACVWNAKLGKVQIYTDGKLSNELNRDFSLDSIQGKVFFGCDMGTPISAKRWADCDMDEITFYNKDLLPDKIKMLYNNNIPDPQSYYRQYINQKPAPVMKKNTRIIRDEIRAIFDEGNGWTTPAGANKTLKRIKRAGFNVYVPCVWHGQGSRFPSTIAPAEANQKFPNGDPLANLIKVAHNNGIKVYPWFCVALRQKTFLQDYYAPETPRSAFDLQRPGFRKFITETILDVVKRYDVDGVNLDYIRTMGVCTCGYCRNQYRSRFNRNLLDDIKQKSIIGRLEPHLQQWVDSAVTSIVSDIAVQARKSKPNLILSVDGHPKPSFLPPNREGSNVIAWANAGLIDLIFNMDYSARPDFESYDLVRKECNDPRKLLMLLGNYERMNGKIVSRSASLFAGNVNYVRNTWGNGFGVYIYSLLSDEQIDSLLANLVDLKL